MPGTEAGTLLWTLLPPLVAAPAAGSFLGVLIRRLPAGKPVALARSECEHCRARLGVRDLLPVVSYLLARGRCRQCRAPIGRFHLWIELAALGLTAIAALAAYGRGESAGWLWSSCGLGWVLLALAAIDLDSWRLPDVLTLPLLLAGLAVCGWLRPDELADHVMGAVFGWGLLTCLALAYRALRGRDGLGGGDAKLLGAGGAWLGAAALPVILLAASAATLLAVLLRAGMRGERAGGLFGGLRAGTAVPFGPGLAAAIWILWLWFG